MTTSDYAAECGDHPAERPALDPPGFMTSLGFAPLADYCEDDDYDDDDRDYDDEHECAAEIAGAIDEASGYYSDADPGL